MIMKFRGLAVFDIDGVLADFEERMCEAFGYDNREMYRLEDRYPELDRGLIEEFSNSPENYRDLTPIFGGILLFTQIKLRGYYCVLATSRPRTLKSVTVDWLNRYNVRYEELIFTGNKVETIKDIESINADLSLKFSIDDSVSVLEKVQNVYMNSVPVLAWGQAWNQGYYPRLRYNENRMKIEAQVGEGSNWKWIWEK